VSRATKPATRSTSPAARLDPAARREQLVVAAASLFEAHDPTLVTFEAVADAAGVSRSLVYAYFGDRGGLFAAVYLRNLERLDAELGRAIDAQLSDETRLRRIVRCYLEFARDNEGAWQVIAAAGALAHPAVRGARRDRIERIAAAWDGTPEARLVATAVVALLEAGVHHWYEERGLGIERATRLLTDVIWSGLSNAHVVARAAG
jgi:AcrR family transcriptional regulator